MTAPAFLLGVVAAFAFVLFLVVVSRQRLRLSPCMPGWSRRRGASAFVPDPETVDRPVGEEDRSPSFRGGDLPELIVVPRVNVPRLPEVGLPAGVGERVMVTEGLDEALVMVQAEITERVRRRDDAELLEDTGAGVEHSMLLIAAPGGARDHVEAVLAQGAPYGISGFLLEDRIEAGEEAPAPGTEPIPAGPGIETAPMAQAQAEEAGQGSAGLIRLLGRYALDGPAGQGHARARDMWALLGLLAETRTSLLTRSRAQEMIWADSDTPVDRFSALLKETRARLCDALGRPHNQGRYVIQFVGSAGYRLNPELCTVDVWQLRDALARAGEVAGEERAAALSAAVGLFTGTYLPGSAHGWAKNASRALDRQIAQALAQLATLEEDPARAVLHLENATGIDPVAEHLYRRRMQGYADLGRVEAVHHCHEQLTDQLRAHGRRPEDQTVQLYRRLTT